MTFRADITCCELSVRGTLLEVHVLSLVIAFCEYFFFLDAAVVVVHVPTRMPPVGEAWL